MRKRPPLHADFARVVCAADRHPALPRAIDNRAFDHTSLLATVKNLFQLPHFLTRRDASAYAFDDLLLNDPRPDNELPRNLEDRPLARAPSRDLPNGVLGEKPAWTAYARKQVRADRLVEPPLKSAREAVHELEQALALVAASEPAWNPRRSRN